MTKSLNIAVASPAPAGVSTTELGYVDGVTSAIQTQLGARIANTLTSTTGDTIYASGANTPARLGIGSTGQVLTVAGGIPSWAAAGGGSFTKIVSASFSATTAVNVNNCFSATYTRYKILLKYIGDAGAYTTFLKFRVGGVDISTAAYYYAGVYFTTGATGAYFGGSAATTGFDLGSGSQNPNFNTAECEVFYPFVNNLQCDIQYKVTQLGQSGASMGRTAVGSHNNTVSGIIDGFSLLFSGASTGELTVYGYAN